MEIQDFLLTDDTSEYLWPASTFSKFLIPGMPSVTSQLTESSAHRIHMVQRPGVWLTDKFLPVNAGTDQGQITINYKSFYKLCSL